MRDVVCSSSVHPASLLPLPVIFSLKPKHRARFRAMVEKIRSRHNTDSVSRQDIEEQQRQGTSAGSSSHSSDRREKMGGAQHVASIPSLSLEDQDQGSRRKGPGRGPSRGANRGPRSLPGLLSNADDNPHLQTSQSLQSIQSVHSQSQSLVASELASLGPQKSILSVSDASLRQRMLCTNLTHPLGPHRIASNPHGGDISKDRQKGLGRVATTESQGQDQDQKQRPSIGAGAPESSGQKSVTGTSSFRAREPRFGVGSVTSSYGSLSLGPGTYYLQTASVVVDAPFRASLSFSSRPRPESFNEAVTALDVNMGAHPTLRYPFPPEARVVGPRGVEVREPEKRSAVFLTRSYDQHPRFWEPPPPIITNKYS